MGSGGYRRMPGAETTAGSGVGRGAVGVGAGGKCGSAPGRPRSTASSGRAGAAPSTWGSGPGTTAGALAAPRGAASVGWPAAAGTDGRRATGAVGSCSARSARRRSCSARSGPASGTGALGRAGRGAGRAAGDGGSAIPVAGRMILGNSVDRSSMRLSAKAAGWCVSRNARAAIAGTRGGSAACSRSAGFMRAGAGFGIGRARGKDGMRAGRVTGHDADRQTASGLTSAGRGGDTGPRMVGARARSPWLSRMA